MPPEHPERRPDHDHDGLSMPLGDHLEELRKRIVFGLLGLVPIFVLSLVFGQALLAIIIVPAQDALRDRGLPAVLQATSPLETFGAYLRVALIMTALLGSPWLLYQLWRFVRPGLYIHERRFVRVLSPLSAALTAGAAAFLYYLMLPLVLTFFIGFGQSVQIGSVVETAEAPAGISFPELPVLDADPEGADIGSVWLNPRRMELRVAVPDGSGTSVRALPLTSGTGVAQQFRVSEYIKMVFSLALALTVAFQLPPVVLLLGWVGIVTPAFLTRYRRYALLVCALAGALLTPSDPISMVILMVPLYALFELGVLLLRLLPAERREPDGEADEPAES